jgi:hypothetical protein
MRVKYNNGGPISEELRKKQIISSLNQSQEPPRDPILNRLAAERFAQDYTNMREQAYDQYIIPDPRETGQVNPDRSYILEAAMLAGGLPRGGAKAVGSTATRGGVPEIDAARRASIDAMSQRMGQKRMLNEQQKRIADDRLQYISDRLLNEAQTEDMVSGANLQGQLTDVLESAIKGEKDRVDDILNAIIRDESAKRAARDEINSLAEMLSGRSGGDMGSLLSGSGRDFMGMGDQSMIPYLANPSRFKGVAGYPRLPYDVTRPASRNEYGGKIK